MEATPHHQAIKIGVKRQSKGRKATLTLDLAADIADDPAQPAAQETQLPLMPLELFGVGVAAGHHRRGSGDPAIGLPQPDPVPGRQAIEPFDGRMQELGVGRKGDGLRLHGGMCAMTARRRRLSM